MTQKELNIWAKLFWTMVGIIVIIVVYHFFIVNRKPEVNQVMLDRLIKMNDEVIQMRKESKEKINTLIQNFDSLDSKQKIIIKEQPIHYEKYYNNTVYITSATDSEHYSYLPTLAATWDSLERLGVWWDKPKAYRAIPVDNE